MVRYFSIVLVGLFLTSCNNKLAQKCANLFPCKEIISYVGIGVPDSIPYIGYDTLYSKGKLDSTELSNRSDVLWSDGHSITNLGFWKGQPLINYDYGGKIKEATKEEAENYWTWVRPVIKWKHDTIPGKQKIIKILDTAKQKVLQDSIQLLKNKLEKSESLPRTNLPWWLAIIVALIGYGFYRGTKK